MSDERWKQRALHRHSINVLQVNNQGSNSSALRLAPDFQKHQADLCPTCRLIKSNKQNLLSYNWEGSLPGAELYTKTSLSSYFQRTHRPVRGDQVKLYVNYVIGSNISAMKQQMTICKMIGRDNLYIGAQKKEAMAPHSSTLTWKVPWMEEPGRLWSMGSHRVGHD